MRAEPLKSWAAGAATVATATGTEAGTAPARATPGPALNDDRRRLLPSIAAPDSAARPRGLFGPRLPLPLPQASALLLLLEAPKPLDRRFRCAASATTEWTLRAGAGGSMQSQRCCSAAAALIRFVGS